MVILAGTQDAADGTLEAQTHMDSSSCLDERPSQSRCFRPVRFLLACQCLSRECNLCSLSE